MRAGACLIAMLMVAMSLGYCQEQGQKSLGQQYSESGPAVLPLLKEKLKTGTPSEKEAVITIFLNYKVSQLFPDVIEATLDDTPLPRHGDTGWGNVYHQAASALCSFAALIDGLDQETRGLKQFTFFDEVGTASARRRQEVHANWAQWWELNRPRGRK